MTARELREGDKKEWIGMSYLANVGRAAVAMSRWSTEPRSPLIPAFPEPGPLFRPASPSHSPIGYRAKIELSH